MFGILAVFVQAAVGQIAYLALRLESGSFPRPLHPAEEQAAFAALQNGDAAARDRGRGRQHPRPGRTRPPRMPGNWVIRPPGRLGVYDLATDVALPGVGVDAYICPTRSARSRCRRRGCGNPSARPARR